MEIPCINKVIVSYRISTLCRLGAGEILNLPARKPISELPWASPSKRGLVHSTTIHMKMTYEISFSSERMGTKTRFEKEAKAYWETGWNGMIRFTGIGRYWLSALLYQFTSLFCCNMSQRFYAGIQAVAIQKSKTTENFVHWIFIIWEL